MRRFLSSPLQMVCSPRLTTHPGAPQGPCVLLTPRGKNININLVFSFLNYICELLSDCHVG